LILSCAICFGTPQVQVCGTNLQIVSGRGRNHQSQTYGCPMNFHRGESVCSNHARVRRDVLEREPLQRLQSKVFRDDVTDAGMVPGGRVELPTPAFSGPRSTGELPRHRKNSKIVAARSCDVEGQYARAAVPAESVGMMSSYFRDSSNSRIQSFFLSTSRGLVPSAGPTIPSFSMMSISRAARP
jgi:hypothetical protein